MTKNFIKLVLFGLAAIGAFTLFAVWYAPEAPRPAREEAQGPVPLDGAGIAALGERIFFGKGNCNLCHDPKGLRAPSLENMSAVALERIKDPRYKGKATDAAQYIYESMVNPSLYVVKGYGIGGSNDTASPMPQATGPVIGLTEAEARAVTAYLLVAGGNGAKAR